MGLGIVVGVIALGFTVMQFFLPVFGLRALIPATGQSPSAAAVEPQLAAPVAPPSAVPTTTVPAASPSAAPQTHALEVPFEIDGLSLLMHRVGDGETFEVIDLKYKTTPEVIRALNPSVGASLWAGSVIVIASGMQAVDASLPGFKTHEVDEPTTTIDKVALEYNIDVALLMRYNGCADACELSKGDWVLIPVPKQ
jgi:LysM repeat protein